MPGTDYHVFTHEGKHHVIGVATLATAVVDEATAAALANREATPDTPLDSGTKAKLLELGVLAEHEEKEEAGAVPVTGISLFVTQDCNLDCIYCYGDGGHYGSSGHMAPETARKAVDWLIDQAGEEKSLSISFFGGEPLLNFPLVKEVADYALKSAEETGKEFKFAMTTNLSLLREDKLAFLQEYKITPMVSFDGPKALQDRQRPFKHGDGSSYDATLPKIKRLLEVIPDCHCRATLVGDNDPDAIVAALHEIGFSAVDLAPASDSLFGGGTEGEKARNTAKTLETLEDDAAELLQNVKARNREGLQRQKRSGLLCYAVARLSDRQKKRFPCGAGRGSLAVSNVGELYICHRFVGHDEYRVGSVDDKEVDREPYLSRSVDSREKCGACFSKYICAGGCYYDNKGMTGSDFEPADATCLPMKRSVELAAHIVCNLTEEDREYLVDEKIIPEAQPTDEELQEKRKTLLAELEDLGLTEAEFKEVAAGMTFDEFTRAKCRSLPDEKELLLRGR